MILKRVILTLWLLLTLPLSAHAQTSDEIPYFDIELILFENSDQNAGGEEFWGQENTIPFNPAAIPIQTAQVIGYTLLPETTLELKPEASTLERSGRYRTLTHLRWRQPGLDKKHVKPISLSGERLEGTITISLRRYLHADFDMLLNRFSSKSSSYQGYRFLESRRMRSNELHYIDHPVMGALIKITRVESSPVSQLDTAVDNTQASETETPIKEIKQPD